jgi:hypothetical protein
MRHTLLLALALPILIQAQNWAPIGATWTYKQGSCCGPDTNLAVITAIGDTVIDGRSCTELTMEEGWSGCHSFLRFFSESNDSLYYQDPNTGQFLLLFHWNAVPGDSWYTPVNDDLSMGDTLDWTVTDTGSVVIASTNLRTWQVEVVARNQDYYTMIGQVIERLGPLSMPFTWSSGACDGEIFLGLRCYEDNDISWQSPSAPQCALSTSIADPADRSAFKLGPNPVAAGAPIFFEIHSPTIRSIVLVRDALGREVQRLALTDSPAQLVLTSAGPYVVTLLEGGVPVAQQRLVVR